MLRNRSHSSEDTSSKYEGYAVDLIEKISEELNFTYDFYLNDGNGNYDENSQTWTGVIGDVVSGVLFYNVIYILNNQKVFMLF